MVIVPLGTFLYGNDIIFLISQKRFSYGGPKNKNLFTTLKIIIIKNYDLYLCLKFPLKEE
jgi:hypothetical protein